MSAPLCARLVEVGYRFAVREPQPGPLGRSYSSIIVAHIVQLNSQKYAVLARSLLFGVICAQRWCVMCRSLRTGLWCALPGAVAVVVAGAVCRSFALVLAGVLLAWAALALFWLGCVAGGLARTGGRGRSWREAQRLPGGSQGRLVQVEGVQVGGVFRLGRDLLVYLCGGEGYRAEVASVLGAGWPAGGAFFLSWRTRWRRSAARVARRLGTWQACGSRLRFVGGQSHCWLVLDERHCLALPRLLAIG